MQRSDRSSKEVPPPAYTEKWEVYDTMLQRGRGGEVTEAGWAQNAIDLVNRIICLVGAGAVIYVVVYVVYVVYVVSAILTVADAIYNFAESIFALMMLASALLSLSFSS